MMAAHNGKLDPAAARAEGEGVAHRQVRGGEDGADGRRRAEEREGIGLPRRPEGARRGGGGGGGDGGGAEGAAVAASKMAGAAQAAAARQEEVHKARVEAAEALEATLAAAKPVWPEVEAVLDKTLRCSRSRARSRSPARRTAAAPSTRRSGRASALRAADRDDALIDDDAARALPPLRAHHLNRLVQSLGALPDELCALKKLRNLEAAGNQIAALPAGVGGMATLQTVDLSNNALADIGGLKESRRSCRSSSTRTS